MLPLRWRFAAKNQLREAWEHFRANEIDISPEEILLKAPDFVAQKNA
jgi:hypothetical protein